MKCRNAIIYKLAGVFLFFFISVQPAAAGVTIAGTRIIFPGGEREKSVRTTNHGDRAALIQVWVDDGARVADLNKIKVPFTATPPVYRVEPGKGQSVRLIYNGMTLPQDRESVFWFNLLEIPPVDESSKDKDRLELAFRTRIKIFYRPPSLKGSSTGEVARLSWEKNSTGIKVTNPTPYYFSFESLTLRVGNSTWALKTDMISPFSSTEFRPEKLKEIPSTLSGITFRLLNDYGSVQERQLTYSPGKGFRLEDK